jgi:hypothetical protein
LKKIRLYQSKTCVWLTRFLYRVSFVI